MNRIWERNEIIALRERAQAVALEDDIAGTWRRAYQRLADTLDNVDAITARCEVRPGPSVTEHTDHMTNEQAVHDELNNIAKNAPLFPGNTISHATANECVTRGWAKRADDGSGNFVLTPLGADVLRGPTEVRERLAEREFVVPEGAMQGNGPLRVVCRRLVTSTKLED